jgi:segregation and condensation protein B
MLKSQIESLLFISSKPISIKHLSELLKQESKNIENAGDELVEQYKAESRGLQIIKNSQRFQMVSSPDNAEVVREFVKDETTGELTRPSLETLTVIAYRGPISKIDLERIRGVNCSIIIRNLLLRGLIEQRFSKTKNENYFTVTFDFLRFLGVNDVKELPDYVKLNTHDSLDKILHNGKEEESSLPKIAIEIDSLDDEEVSAPD